MIEILNTSGIAHAREAGALVAHILQTLRNRTDVGTNLLSIDEWAKTMILKAGAKSCYIDYAPAFGRGPFGHYICTSVNDAALNGLPHRYRLRDGDLITLDLAVTLNGYAADSAISFIVGTPDPADLALIGVTEQALRRGINAAQVGATVGDISHAVGTTLMAAGYPVNTEYGGHGIGTTMHQDPHIPNNGRAGRGYKLQPGMLLAIEPWAMINTDQLSTDVDGWTLRSSTGCRAAHSEHTIAVTATGPEILTVTK